jgi:hypothetical protein
MIERRTTSFVKQRRWSTATEAEVTSRPARVRRGPPYAVDLAAGVVHRPRGAGAVERHLRPDMGRQRPAAGGRRRAGGRDRGGRRRRRTRTLSARRGVRPPCGVGRPMARFSPPACAATACGWGRLARDSLIRRTSCSTSRVTAGRPVRRRATDRPRQCSGRGAATTSR